MRATRLMMLVAALSVSLTVTACNRTVGSATECQIFAPLTWSSRDTPETIRGIKGHNAAGEAACGWRP